jgi:hypothetical protein
LIWLKLLLLLMMTVFPPQPAWQQDPPQMAAPIMNPKLKETKAAPGGYGG